MDKKHVCNMYVDLENKIHNSKFIVKIMDKF